MSWPDDFSPRGRPVKFCQRCGRNLTLGVFEQHAPCRTPRMGGLVEYQDYEQFLAGVKATKERRDHTLHMIRMSDVPLGG